MSEAWWAMPAAVWESIIERLPRPLTKDEAAADLRHHENEVRRGGWFPGRTALCARWGWGDRAVRNLLASESWHDPQAPVDVSIILASRRPPYMRAPKRRPRTAQEGVQGAPKDRPSDERTNADNRPPGAQETPKDRPRGSPRGAQEGVHRARSFPEPENQEPDTPAVDVKPADVFPSLWKAIHVACGPHPPGRATLSAENRKALKAITKDGWGLNDIVMVWLWRCTSDHDRARFIRDRGDRWPTIAAHFETYRTMAGPLTAPAAAGLILASEPELRTWYEAEGRRLLARLYADHHRPPLGWRTQSIQDAWAATVAGPNAPNQFWTAVAWFDDEQQHQTEDSDDAAVQPLFG